MHEWILGMILKRALKQGLQSKQVNISWGSSRRWSLRVDNNSKETMNVRTRYLMSIGDSNHKRPIITLNTALTRP